MVLQDSARGSEAFKRRWLLARMKVNENGCWIWQRACSNTRHATAAPPWEDRITSAYRIAYEVFIGAIPEGLVLHHECRDGRCINPAHLVPMSQRENVMIGMMDRGQWPVTHLCRVCRNPIGVSGTVHIDCGKEERAPEIRERIIAAMQRYADIYGSPPSAVAWNVAMARRHGRDDLIARYLAGDWPATSGVQRAFGSWSAAIAAAGFAPNAVGGAAHRQ